MIKIDFKNYSDIGFQAGSNFEETLNYMKQNYNVTGFHGFGNHFEKGDDTSFWIRVDDKKIFFSNILNIDAIVKTLGKI